MSLAGSYDQLYQPRAKAWQRALQPVLKATSKWKPQGIASPFLWLARLSFCLSVRMAEGFTVVSKRLYSGLLQRGRFLGPATMSSTSLAGSRSQAADP